MKMRAAASFGLSQRIDATASETKRFVSRAPHAGLEGKVSTGLRFHPNVILLSDGHQTCHVTVLRASALAVVIFEVLLNTTSMFSHGNNVRILLGIDSWRYSHERSSNSRIDEKGQSGHLS
jgi:hypothetical protein